MVSNRKLEGCCETVIAALAEQIEQLQDELRWKQERLENLERLNEDLKIRLEKASAKDVAIHTEDNEETVFHDLSTAKGLGVGPVDLLGGGL